jgi:hypothetical protein
MAAPVNKISVGNVTLNVWENEVGRGNDKFTVQSVSIQKNYKKDDKWESSSSFKHNELPFVIMACQKALEDRYLKAEVNFLDD